MHSRMLLCTPGRLGVWHSQQLRSRTRCSAFTKLRGNRAARLPGLVVQDLEALAIVLRQVRDHRYALFYPRDHIVRLHQSHCSQHSL